jgi:nucleotide-binding universal stress UspA family protein
VVCLDRSDVAEVALPLAGYLARMDGAPLTLLHVLDTMPDPAGMRATDALEWEMVRQEAGAYLSRHAERMATEGVEVDRRLVEGSAAHGIAACAVDLGADLLVLSTRGEGGVDIWPVGSTAQKALTLAQGAVLVVPAGGATRRPQVPPMRLLVPLDGSLRSESVLPTVIRIARASDAEVALVHAVPDPVRTEVLASPEDLALAHDLAERRSAAAMSYLERIRSRLSAAGVRSTVKVSRATDHHEGLLALIAAQRSDLVVVAAQGAICNPRRRLGSVTSHMVSHSPVPVLIIQHLPALPSGAVTALPSRPPPRSVDAGGDGD